MYSGFFTFEKEEIEKRNTRNQKCCSVSFNRSKQGSTNKRRQHLFLLLGGRPIDADDDGVVSLVRLEGDLLLRLHLLGLHLLDLAGEDDLGLGGRVDAVGLDGDDEVAAVLQEVGGVDGDDSSLSKSERSLCSGGSIKN